VTGYDHGNTRLRARRAALRGEQYAALLGRDLPGLLAALAATSYRPQAAAAAGTALLPQAAGATHGSCKEIASLGY
jgi:hypothetical protein